MAFTTLVFAQLFNRFNARSDTTSAFRHLFTNRLLWAAIGFSVLAPDAMARPLSGGSLSAAPSARPIPLLRAHGSCHAISPAAVPSRRSISVLWVSSLLSRFTTAAMRARWVKAWGKLPTCCPVGSISSE
jgi:hypothetical protein